MECRVIRQTMYLLEDKDRWMKSSEKRVVQGKTIQYCMIGALKEVCSQYGADYNAVERRVRKQVVGFSSIPSFNDALKTTHTDVVNVLQRAAADCK